jgi:hypothetical protein
MTESNSQPNEHYSEMSLGELADVLSLTIKHDYENKLVTFLGMLSAFTDDSQLNISFNAPSSSGKTYTVTEIAKLFPEEDKIELSGASPTSFLYGAGEYDEERDAKIVHLERKIFILSEQQDTGLQARLRPVLSHDQRELSHRMTNKSKNGANRAELIIVRGFPATVFCSAGQRMDEQEATRAILLSPELTEEKLYEGVHLQAMRGANTAEFMSSIDTNKERLMLKRRIVAIRDEMVDDIIIPDSDVIEERFKTMLNGKIKPRNMRDMDHLMKLIKAIALLNVWYRRQGDNVIANQEDIDQAFNLFSYFMESLQLGISPALLSFYKDFILMLYYEKRTEIDDDEFEMLYGVEPLGISRSDLSKYYLKCTGKALNEDQLRKEYLPQLENCGLIQQARPSTGDRRVMHIYPLMFFDDQENNIGSGCVPKISDNKEILDKVDNIFQS